MGRHLWMRELGNYEREWVETEGLTPPEGEGWVLASKFGVGYVQGGGESPPRSSR